jgi:energy-coupling factor transporter transmembrane protein EcfT
MKFVERALRRVHPATKLAALLAISANAFLLDNAYALLALFVVLVLATLAGRIRLGAFKWLFAAALGGVPLMSAVFALAAYERLGDWAAALESGLLEAAIFSLRVKTMALANLVVVRSTSLGDALDRLRALGISEKASLFLAALARFVPSAFEEGKRILETQRCRGFAYRKLFLPAHYLPLAIPLFLAQTKRAADMTIVAETRSFALGPRARLGGFGIVDIAVAAVVAASFLLLYWNP